MIHKPWKPFSYIRELILLYKKKRQMKKLKEKRDHYYLDNQDSQEK